jgi:hypothetical protein
MSNTTTKRAGFGQPDPDATLLDTTAYGAAPDDSITDTTESAAITHHVATLGGVAMPYMSAAGHLVAVDPLSSKPVANVAFTADGVGPSTRPVLFCNGGRAPAGSYDNWS